MTNLWLIAASNPLATENLAHSMENEIDIEIRHKLRERGIEQQYAWEPNEAPMTPMFRYTGRCKRGAFACSTQRIKETSMNYEGYRWVARITEKTRESSCSRSGLLTITARRIFRVDVFSEENAQ